MISKKAPKADLERKRFAFFQIGLIMAGSLCLAAFEFVTPVFSTVDKQTWDQDTVLTMSEIPIELVAYQQPKRKAVQPIVDRVKLVVKLPPNPVKSKLSQTIDMDLDILKAFGGDEPGTFIPTDLGPLTDVEKMPEFPGNLGQWIAKNMKLPDYVFRSTGTIYVSFVVTKTGEVTDVKISKSLDPDHDRAAIAVVKKMPKWTPGEQFGKPVAVNYHLPIKIVSQ